MKNNNLSDSDVRFVRAFEATLKYTALPKEQVSCSRGSLKRWVYLLHILTEYAAKNGKTSPICWALDRFHWGIDHFDSPETAEVELVNAILDELKNGAEAIKSWRREAVFTDLVTNTIDSFRPLDRAWRWVYTDAFFNYLRNRTLDLLFHKDVQPQNIDLAVASDYEIRYSVRVARARRDWKAFESSICHLLPEVTTWPAQKRRNEREIRQAFIARYGFDYAAQEHDFNCMMNFLNAHWSKSSGGLRAFLGIQHFSENLARGVWPKNTQEELEKLFLRSRTQLAVHKRCAERNVRFTYRYDSYGERLRNSWLFRYMTECHTNGRLTEKNRLKISKALMELSMGLL